MAQTIALTLPDGSIRQHEAGITAHDIALSISEGLARNALAARVNGEVVETNRPISQDAKIEILTWRDLEGKSTFWHSSAHIMAEAILRHFPEAKLTIGPPIENGFYYDVDFGGQVIGAEDIAQIEKSFIELARSGETFERREVTKAEALAHFEGNEYKTELIQNLEDGSITFYQSGEFVDLCKGPHIPNSKVIKAFKVLNQAGAYWRGDNTRPMLTRIYGISFPSQKELDEYLHWLEEARKRDHRKLGRELRLFSFHEEGPGFPFWHNNGMVLMNGLKDYLRKKLRELEYEEIQTPVILNEQLWHQSGHWQNYSENMYFTQIDDAPYAVKPMNCPGSTLVYRTEPRSYRELPLRLYEFGLVHRHELSGVLAGLFRVRAFTQDDAHIFCTPDQVAQEIRTTLNLILGVYRDFGFNEVRIKLSTRPEKYIGTIDVWDHAESTLQRVLEEEGIEYQLNPGDGAFYGPKIDFTVRDSLRRDWQLGTIQLDFSMPIRFGLEYIGADSDKHRPVMIHRAVLGSFERFVGILIEHTAGNFPLWLAPRQVSVMSISEKYEDYARQVAAKLNQAGIRAEADLRSEKISRKVRDAEVGKIAYMLVVGEKEQADGTISVRRHGEGDLGSFTLPDFLAKWQEWVLE
jgi:threonyl-tRNA synthetase